MERKLPVTSVDRGQHRPKYRSSFETTLQFHSERKDDASAYAPCLSNRHTGIPILRALSARFSTIPEPGKTMTPIGRASSITSFRLNVAAFLCRVQSGLKTTCATLRLSAQRAAIRSAPFGPAPWRRTMSGCFARTLSRVAQKRSALGPVNLHRRRPGRAPVDRRRWR